MKIILFLSTFLFSISAFSQIDFTAEYTTEKGALEVLENPTLSIWNFRDNIKEQNVKNFMMPPRHTMQRDRNAFYALASLLEFYINLESNFKINLSPDFIKLNTVENKNNNSLHAGLKFLKEQGTVDAAYMPFGSSAPSTAIYNAERFKINDYYLIFRKESNSRSKIFELRKALMRGHPILVEMKVNNQFFGLSIKSEDWEMDRNAPTLSHSVLVVGYDEDKDAFEIMNTQGPDWGVRGCIWMDYDNFADLAVEGVVLKM